MARGSKQRPHSLQRGQALARSHNHEVKQSGSKAEVRITSCLLPKQSPWLNVIEPEWIHSKRKLVEPDGLLGAYELAERVCRVFSCPHCEHYPFPTAKNKILEPHVIIEA